MERVAKPRPPLVAVPAPSASPARGAPATLPIALTPLVGRLTEVAAIAALLRRPEMRLLTLTGAPGIGKTRLAMQVAREQAAAFPDGVSFLLLAPIRDPELVVPAIARAVGAREATDASLIERVSAALEDRTALLVLDNFEQVADAAPEIVALLAACPRLTALVTSRSILHVRGEHEYVVPPLDLPDVAALPAIENLARCEAVALFLQCARATEPEFHLTPANARAVAEICVQLDGLPLAIELAVPRLKLFAPDALRKRLEHRLPWLTDGPRDLPMRHRALRSAIAWSDELLQPEERRLFRRLAVFTGGWTMDAAEAVCADADPDARRGVVDGIASLLDKSLLRRIPQANDALRFLMLETIREYAMEQLAASDEHAVVRGRHAAYYTALAEQAEPHLYGAEQGVWLERIEREGNNIRAALAWSLESGAAETALRLVGSLQNFWLVHDHLREGVQWAERTLAYGDAPLAVRARTLSCAATCALRLGDYERAKEWYDENLALCRHLGDRRLIAQVHINLGSLASVQGAMDEAVARFTEGLALARAVGDRRTAARALNLLGEAARFAGDDAQAATYYAESLPLCRDLAENERIAMVLRNLAPVIHRLGDPARARAMFAESLTLSAQLRNTHGIAVCLAAFGGTLRPEHAAHAARLLSAADALRASIGVQREPVDQAEFDRGVAAARARLDAATFDALWAEGAALTSAQAVEAAQRVLGTAGDAPPARSASPEAMASPLGGLTRREYEVATQVALGKTNRAIADALFIAEKTVEMHVSNSLSKLGFRSRAQLAAWAVGQNATQPAPGGDQAPR